MFYAQFVLSKKGPLAKIWLAAHWEKKLSKAQIYETNVQDAVDEILKPKVKMALRTTGHLLLGIVRIYSRKAKYLLADCNEAFLKIKMAFRPGQVDLPDEGREAQLNAITLPEVYHDFDAALPDFNDLEMQSQLQINQSRIDDITLKEDVPEASRMPFGADFGTDDFGENALGLFGDDDTGLEAARAGSMSLGGAPSLLHGAHLHDDDFFGTGGDTAGAMPDDFGDFAPDQMLEDVVFNENELARGMESIEAPGADQEMPMDGMEGAFATTAESSFALEPLDAAIAQGLERTRPAQRRRRRLIIDEMKNIGGDEMKANMADYRDTLQPLDLAPPTKRLMMMRESGSVDRLFHNPGCSALRAPHLIKLYQSHLVLHGRDSGSVSAIEVRRDLDMLDQLSDIQEEHAILQEERDEFDDLALGGGAHSPGGSPLGVAHLDEDGTTGISPKHSPTKGESPEKKKERKSRASAVERDEDDGGVDGDDDHRWTKRTQMQLNAIAAKLKASDGDAIPLTDMLTKNATRKSAAQKFYTLLVLTKWQAVSVEQDEPYGEILIAAGPHIAQYTTA